MSTTSTPSPKPRGGAFWPAAIVGLLAMNMVIVGITVFYATTDPSVAVEPNYYDKAVHWDQAAAQEQVNHRLGWRIDVSVSTPGMLTVKVADASGTAVDEAQIEIVAFHNARSGDRQLLHPESQGAGVYAAPIRIDMDGDWHFRVKVHRASDTFTSEFDHRISAAPHAPGVAMKERER